MGTVKRKRPAAQGETKGRAPATEELPADELLTDSDALDQIRGLLASRPWDAEAVEQVAALIRETGRDVEYRETGREVEAPDDELGIYDDAEGDEGWLYRDEDQDDEPAQLVASAYARISRIAGAESPLPYHCPHCGYARGRTPSDLRELGTPQCPDCNEKMILTDEEFEPPSPPESVAPPRGPLASCYDSGFGTVDFTCNSCGTKVESRTLPPGWTESGKSHRCPACAAGAAAPRGMSGEQLAALKANYLLWSGGFEPETVEDISTYADAAMDINLDRGEAVNALTEWLKETDPSGIVRRASR
jgi:rubrerythrin